MSPFGRVSQCGPLPASSRGTSCKVVGAAATSLRSKYQAPLNRQFLSGLELPDRPRRFQRGVRRLGSLPQLVPAALSLLLVALNAVVPLANAGEASEIPTVEALAAWRGGAFSDARMLARRIHLGETSELIMNERRLGDLAIETDQVLMNVGSRYPGTAEVAARSRFRPATPLMAAEGRLFDAIARRWHGTGSVPLAGFEEFVELNSRLGLHTWETVPLFASVILHFSEHANRRAARQACLAVDGVVGAAFDTNLGAGPDIAATRVSGRWFVMMRKAWDCLPAACIRKLPSLSSVTHMLHGWTGQWPQAWRISGGLCRPGSGPGGSNEDETCESRGMIARDPARGASIGMIQFGQPLALTRAHARRILMAEVVTACSGKRPATSLEDHG